MNTKAQTLEELLNLQVVDDLKKLVRLLDIEGQLPTRKADLITAIVHELTTNLRDYWNALDATQQKAVAEALYADTFDSGGFRIKYGQDPNWGEKSQWERSIVSPSLLNLFLLQTGNTYYTGYQRAVPEDLKTTLKEFVPKPPPAQIPTLESRPTTVPHIEYTFHPKTHERQETEYDLPLYHAETEHIAQTDLLSVLRLIDTGQVRISDKTGFPTTKAISTLSEVLQNGDFYPEDPPENSYAEPPGAIKAFAWPILIHTAKLARSKSGKLELTSKGRKALNEPPHETIKAIWLAWLSNKKFDELRRVNAIKGQTGKGKRGLTPPAERRDIIVRTLKKCPVDTWFEAEVFCNFMRALRYILTVSNDPWELYIDEKYYGNLGDDTTVLKLSYTLTFLFEYMATLGLIDITYSDPEDGNWEFDVDINDLYLSRYDGLQHLKINHLGAYCLGLKRTYTPSETATESILKVLPNSHVVALKPLSKSDQIALEQFTKKKSNSVWTIQSDKLLKAVESGQSLNHMHAFLKQKSVEELPQSIAVLFQDITQKVSSLKMQGMAHLIEVKDAETAQYLSHERTLQKHCFLAGKNHLVVPEKSLTAFRSALRKIGYVLPK